MMRIFFLVTFVANIVLTLVSWVILPDTVAIHFRHDGMPDGWSPVWFHVLIFLGMQLVLFVTIYLGSKLKLGLPRAGRTCPTRTTGCGKRICPRHRRWSDRRCWSSAPP